MRRVHHHHAAADQWAGRPRPSLVAAASLSKWDKKVATWASGVQPVFLEGRVQTPFYFYSRHRGGGPSRYTSEASVKGKGVKGYTMATLRPRHPFKLHFCFFVPATSERASESILNANDLNRICERGRLLPVNYRTL